MSEMNIWHHPIDDPRDSELISMSDYFYKDYIKPITKEDIDAFSKALDEFYDKWMKRTFENGKNNS